MGLPSSSSFLLFWAVTAFALAKIMDYPTRSVVFPMAFQPLDFESRYMGKGVIGVLGSRIGNKVGNVSLVSTYEQTFSDQLPQMKIPRSLRD